MQGGKGWHAEGTYGRGIGRSFGQDEDSYLASIGLRRSEFDADSYSSKDTTIRIYDRESHAHLFTYDLHTGPVNCLAIGATGLGEAEQVVSASGDGYWIIWDMISGKEVRRGGGDGRGLACIAWEAGRPSTTRTLMLILQGDRILTGDNDRLIKLFSAGDSTLVKTFEGHTDLVRSLALDKRYNLIISGSYDQSVRMWDLKTGNMIRRMRGNHSSLIFGVATDRGRVVSYVDLSHGKGSLTP